jgi:hypothetical protein
MVRRCFTFAALALLFASKASAHGGFPAAVSLLGLSSEGASVVRLTHGLAYRADDGFRFLCPEAWGGDVSAPAAAIPDGPVVIAAERLFLIGPDGRITPHASELGQGIALAANGDALFGLFRRDGRDALWRITASTAELLVSFDERFSALAAQEGELSVLRFFTNVLVLQTISLTGELRARSSWSMPTPVASAELRVAGERLYVVVGESAAPWFTLGRLGAQGYEQLRDAQSNIAGPLSLATGALFARDGALEALEEGAPLVQPDDYVSCLDSLSAQPFACVREGLMRVDEQGLGDALFAFAALREPDYDAVPEPVRADCSTRWQDLRDHLASAGLWQEPAAAGAAPVSRSDAGSTQRAEAASCALGLGAALGTRCSVPEPRLTCWLSLLLSLGLLVRRTRRSSAHVGRLRPRCARRAPSRR